MIRSPRIYLAIDNCFASRRWTAPGDWAAVVKDLGLTCVEASADNECDPLYTTPEYLSDWMEEVRAVYAQTGVKVVNLYSGHGTYATTGLAHADVRVRDRILNDWLKVMSKLAGRLGAGMGFACHAFAAPVLQDPAAYALAEKDLYDRLAELAAYAHECGTRAVSLEQMYAPHMIPWTVAGAVKLLCEVYDRARQPFYLTIDTGHMCGQRKFQRPTSERLLELLRQFQQTGSQAGMWLGPQSAYDCFRELAEHPEDGGANGLVQVEDEMDRCPHLFARDEDSNPYHWLERLGCYSPIIHLQQTDGNTSAHLPFTRQWNATGIIQPDKVLHALAGSYAMPQVEGLPPRCDSVYLTIEVFSATADLPIDILARLEESVAYWRQWVPRDGLTLDELLQNLPAVRRGSHPMTDSAK